MKSNSKNKCTPRKPKILAFWEMEIEKLTADSRMGTARNYRNARCRFSEFLSSHDIPFSRLSPDLLQAYEHWLRCRGIADNSVAFYLRILRAVFNRAVDCHAAQPQPSLFARVFTGVCATRKRAVSDDVFRRLLALDLSGNRALALSRDMFVFSFCARGMAFVDMAFLRPTDICDGVVSYLRRKTSQRLAFRLEPCMATIVSRYSSGRYVFPVITVDNPADAYRQYQTALGYHNRMLKRLAAMIGYDGRLSTYTARHSWATSARRHAVPLSIISAGLGHTSERTTRIYLDSVENVELDNANRAIINDIISAVSSQETAHTATKVSKIRK